MISRIGLDFDNTVICYDIVLRDIASSLFGIEVKCKNQLKELLFASPDGTRAWQEVQSIIYGERIHDAVPMTGLLDFLDLCARSSIQVSIISHKTEFPYWASGTANLRSAAFSWIRARGLFSFSCLRESSVFFENSVVEKISRVEAQNVELFVDDLPEILEHPSFPFHIQSILFDPNRSYSGSLRTVASFESLGNAIFK